MTSHKFTLSIVIPVYRSANTVGELVRALAALKIPGGHEIILVDDCSPDKSLEVCRSLLQTCPVPLTVISLARNFGEHNAILAGLHHTRGSWVVTMDDDLQNPPSEVVRLLDYAQASDHHVIYTYYAKKEHGALRNLGSRFTNWMASLLIGKPKHLYLSSFRCLSAFVVDQIIRYSGPFPYVDGLILQVTESIDRIQVKHLPRADGRSNYTSRRLVRLWLNLFVNFSVMPLRISTCAGIVLGGVGAVSFVLVTIEALISRTPPGWGSLMAALLALSGAQLLILGLLGEYLGRLYLTACGKPQFVINRVEHSRVDAQPASIEQKDRAGAG